MAKAEWFAFRRDGATHRLRVDQVVYLNGSNQSVMLVGGVVLRLPLDYYIELKRLLVERGEDGDEA